MPFAAAVAGVALWRRRRPWTRQRITDVTLAAVLLVMLAIRYGVLAAIVLAAPGRVLGPDVPDGVAGAVFAVYVGAFAVGMFAWRGSVGRKILGALVMAGVAVFEAIGNALVFDVDTLGELDTGVSIAVALAALVMTAFHWTRRTATPNPLGGKGPPFSY